MARGQVINTERGMQGSCPCMEGSGGGVQLRCPARQFFVSYRQLRMHAPISEPPQTVGDLGQAPLTQDAACQDRRYARKGRAQLCAIRHNPQSCELSMSPKLPQLMSQRRLSHSSGESSPQTHVSIVSASQPCTSTSGSLSAPSLAHAALGKHFRHRCMLSSNHSDPLKRTRT